MTAPARPLDLLELPEVTTLTTLSRATIYRRIKDGSFPPGKLISKRRRAWPPREIAAWIERSPASAET